MSEIHDRVSEIPHAGAADCWGPYLSMRDSSWRRSWILVWESRNDDYDLKLIRGKTKTSGNAVILPYDPTLITQRLEIAIRCYGYNASTTIRGLFGHSCCRGSSRSRCCCRSLDNLLQGDSIDLLGSMLELLLLAFNSTSGPELRGRLSRDMGHSDGKGRTTRCCGTRIRSHSWRTRTTPSSSLQIRISAFTYKHDNRFV